jgi:DNA polymerase
MIAAALALDIADRVGWIGSHRVAWRFIGMHWSLLAPSRIAHRDGERLPFGHGASRSGALPRMEAMVDKQPMIPKKKITPLQKAAAEAPRGSITALRKQARECRACDLWKPATQTVFGEGSAHARIVVIGEQPGDQEDLAGKPFVGPAGKLFDRALEAAGIERDALYVTNAVKHFKFEPRGKVRLHKRANAEEQAACRPWLAAEVDRIDPEGIVCLGAMAAQAVFGSSFRLMAERGRWIELADGRRGLATVHPSYLLRLPGHEAREQGFADFVRDLKQLKEVLG